MSCCTLTLLSVLPFSSFKWSRFWEGDGGHSGDRKKDKSTVNDHLQLWLVMHTCTHTLVLFWSFIDLMSYPAPDRNPNYQPMMRILFLILINQIIQLIKTVGNHGSHLFKSTHYNAVDGAITLSWNQRRCYDTSREDSQHGAASLAVF